MLKNLILNILIRIKCKIDRMSKSNFLLSLNNHASILDVGCGNNSPFKYKFVNPEIQYTGIDIQRYNIDNQDDECADDILIVDRNRFWQSILSQGQIFDAVISSHNIEHVDEPEFVLRAMCDVVKSAGWLYLSFPSKNSTKFPSRKGTLNFYDDPTHRWIPDIDVILKILQEKNFLIHFCEKNHRTNVGYLIGMCLEPFSIMTNRVLPLTWHYWGFETVIWAQKN